MPGIATPRPLRLAIATALAVHSVATWTAEAPADELPTFELEMKDGTLSPDRLVVPAGKNVKIVIRNTGKTPAEFESLELRREKVLGPGVQSFVVLRNLSPGEYVFFDEFHMDTAQGLIIAE